jgi:hypothetical protein
MLVTEHTKQAPEDWFMHDGGGGGGGGHGGGGHSGGFGGHHGGHGAGHHNHHGGTEPFIPDNSPGYRGQRAFRIVLQVMFWGLAVMCFGILLGSIISALRH